MKEKFKFVGLAMAFFFPLVLLMGTIINAADFNFNIGIFLGMPNKVVQVSISWRDIFKVMFMIFLGLLIISIYKNIKEKKKI